MSQTPRNLVIGSFVLLALTLLCVGLFFLQPNYGDGKKNIHVRFTNIDKIYVGTLVTMAGKPVGKVSAIDTIENSRERRSDIFGSAYFYSLTLSLDSSIIIYQQDQFIIQTAGLMGEKTIAIIPKTKNGKDKIIPVKNGEPIYSISTTSINSAIETMVDMSGKFGKAIDFLLQAFENKESTLTKAVTTSQETFAKINTILNQIDKSNLILELNKTFKQTQTLIQNVEKNLQTLDNSLFWDNFGKISQEMLSWNSNMSYLLKDMQNVSKNVNTITASLSQGKGTLGKLLMEDGLYLRTINITEKANTLLNDINHYGLLFHNNSKWKRARTSRLNIMNRLATPSSFRIYFDEELQKINISLTRVSTMLDKAYEANNKKAILKNKDFGKEFLILLRRVQSLEDQLKLYNQSLIDHNK